MRVTSSQGLTAFIFIFIFTAVSSTGCQRSSPDSDDTRERSEARELAARLEGDLAYRIDSVAAEQVESASIEDMLGLPSGTLERIGIRHVSLLRSLYEPREHRPVWIKSDVRELGLTSPGEALERAVSLAESKHGLWSEDYHVPEIERLKNEAGDTKLKKLDAVALTKDEREELVEHLVAHPSLLENGLDRLAHVIAEPEGPTPRIAEIVAERSRAIKLAAEGKARLDLLLSDALIQYGLDMKWSNPAWYRDFDWPEHLQSSDDEAATDSHELSAAHRAVVVKRALLPVFEEPAQVATLLDSMTPRFEQYERLTKAFQQYRTIVRAGGWPTLPADAGELRVGDENAHVTALKKRLAAEGYWSGDTNPRFTRSLREALLDYQRTHQLWEKGVLTSETRVSLNIPAHRRLVQIRLTLERWRNSRIGDDEFFVHINVPDFHAEVWDGAERAMRFRVVTGSTRRTWDEEQKENVFVQATPLLSSKIEHLVFNPYWNVPEGIRRKEIEPKLEENPFYYLDHGYEVNVDEGGYEYLRQKPGDENALGKVKFIFPNEHDVYLHDTNEKQWFRWPTRAFSHGCVRLEEPMAMARHVLEREGRWDEEKIGEFYEKEGETWLRLEEPVPIHIEYYVVRVDDLGRANFLADVYRYDGPRLDAIAQRVIERSHDSPAAPGEDTATVNTR